MGLREWVILLALIFIVVLAADAVRRVRHQRRFHGRYTRPGQPRTKSRQTVTAQRFRVSGKESPTRVTPPSDASAGEENEVPMLVESVDTEPAHPGTAGPTEHADTDRERSDNRQYEFDLPLDERSAESVLGPRTATPGGNDPDRTAQTPERSSQADGERSEDAGDEPAGKDPWPAAPASAFESDLDRRDNAGGLPPSDLAEPEEEDPAPEEIRDSVLEAEEARKMADDEAGEQLLAEPDEVLVISVLAEEDAPYEGPTLLQIMLACGMRFGTRNIFHAMDDQGQLQYSAANAFKPGTFDLENIDQFSTRGVTFFLQLPCQSDPVEAFDAMHKSATTLATYLGGDVLDESRSVMTAQTLTHYRERIRDYQRSQLVKRN